MRVQDPPNLAVVAKRLAPEKVLFVHTPKAGGSNLIETFTQALGYRRLQSRRTDTEGVWHDFEIDDLGRLVAEPDGFISTHTLSFGWSRSGVCDPGPRIRHAIAETLRQFRQSGWFIFTTVRHPGDLLCSFYHYILDHHRRGDLAAVALHVPAVGIPLDVFIAAHCHQPLLPECWSDFDDCLIPTDDSLTEWFFRRFGHVYEPTTAWRHAVWKSRIRPLLHDRGHQHRYPRQTRTAPQP